MIESALRKRDGLAAGLLAVTLVSATVQARAAEPILQSNSALARFLLPYSPFVFDLAIQGARSVAEISYGQRLYDPITENFVVSDLHISRLGVDVRIKRLRLGEDTMMADGVALDTRGLPLPPPFREGLQQLGRETVTADMVSTLKRDDARSAFSFDIAVDLDGIGAISMSGAVDNFHLLVPLSEISGDFSSEPTVAGVLTDASVSYRDDGLAAVATALAAEEQGVSPDDLRNGLAVMPVMSVGGVLDSMQGGASAAFKDRATGWARVIEAFIRKPDTLRVSLHPKEPVSLARFQAGVVTEDLISDLNPEVVSGSDTLTVSAPPVDPLGAAAALIRGDRVPQDRESGAKSLLALAGGGDLEAVKALATTFGTGSVPQLQPAELADLYKFLLVGRALDGQVSDATLSVVAAKLEPVVLRGAEVAAAAYFRGMTEQGHASVALSAATIKTYDAGGLRGLAFDSYEGRGVIRDYTEAYAIALIAAAAGDPLAVSLRDHLASAAQDKRIVLSLDEARARAASLWAVYSKP